MRPILIPRTRFQFLLGRLKTRDTDWRCPSDLGFQFLLGRLKTRILSLEESYGIVFQFLLGRLKTSRTYLHVTDRISVSIPAR